jgi:hypothetical protein
MNVHGDATAVVLHSNAAVFPQSDKDFVTAASHGLIDAVIGYLIDEVMQAALVGAADVHAGPAAHCLPSPEYLNVLGGVPVILVVRRLSGCFLPGHYQFFLEHKKEKSKLSDSRELAFNKPVNHAFVHD